MERGGIIYRTCMLVGIVLAVAMLALVLSNSGEQEKVWKSIKEQITMGQFQTHPTFTTRWIDKSGKAHDVPTVRKDGQTRADWMRDAKADLEASIAGFGPAIEPQADGK